ncbi:MAG TPA: DUF4157 domain-containing protein, partial [Longimicrobium sp.]|nr:DUF4157 domain-containing protein [Longimicrobium sp.]
ARALRADAYTVGADVVFAPWRYAPHTPAGRRLLAHELAHVAQGPADPSAVRRSPADAAPDPAETARKEEEVREYQAYLNENHDTEEMPTSRDKALVLAGRRLRGEAVTLPPNGDALLVLDLLYGAPLHEHRAAALRLLEEMDAGVLEGMVSREAEPGRGKINIWKLAARFEGVEMFEVVDILSGRLHGSYDELRRGKDPLRKADDAELEARTVEWLDGNRKSAEAYFAEVWAAHPVVSLGETHQYGPQQRLFAADMVKRHGGKDVALAVEVKSQSALDAYMKRGDPSRLPDWVFEQGSDRMLDAARANGTRVVAADRVARTMSPKRDAHMAATVQAEHDRGRKVLYYGGAFHVREWKAHHDDPMGKQLALANGEDAYAIVLRFVDPSVTEEPLITALRRRFPSEASIGFDVDRSPMRWRKDFSRASERLGRNIDGLIYFLT